MEFEQEFSSEKKCLEYLIKMRYADGVYTCPLCGSKKSWLVRKHTYECAECHHQESMLSGTLFQDTHKPLMLWFRAIWYITSQKNGTSALGLQRILGIGSYKTAWTWLHKLRRAMVRPGRDRLSGRVEVDEAYIGAPEKGGKTRSRSRKQGTCRDCGGNSRQYGWPDSGRHTDGCFPSQSP